MNGDAYEAAEEEIEQYRSALKEIHSLAKAGSPWLWTSSQIVKVASEALSGEELEI